jgi:Tol biopolymer transport system component
MMLAAAALALGTAPSAAAPVGNGKIAYARDGGIWVVNDDGTGDAPLVATLLGPLAPSPLLWSPDGTRLAGTINPPGSSPSVFVVPAEGGNPVYIGPSTRTGCWLGSDRLGVVVQSGDVGSPKTDVYTADAGGALSTRLTSDGAPKALGAQGCAHDGSKLVYTRFDTTGTGATLPTAYLVAAGGGDPVRLTPGTAADDSPALSPAGTSVAVVRTDAGGARRLVLRDLVSGGERVLSQVPAYTPPLWSPDGRALLFETGHVVGYSRFGSIDHYELHEVAADGSAERDVTPVDGPSSVQPRWSPDGTRILFLSERPGVSANLWSANADGTCPTPIAVATSADYDWQPLPGQAPGAPALCADLSVAASGGYDDVASEEVRSAGLTLRNIGNEVTTDVEVSIAPPADGEVTSLQSSTGTCDPASLRCRLDALPPGSTALVGVEWRSSVPLDFTGRGGPVPETLTATATGAETDPDPTNNTIGVLTLTYPCSQVGHGFRLPDRLVGTAARDVLCGLTGPDSLLGRGGADALVGGPGFDFLDGGSGRDVLIGGGEYDTILASDGQADVVDCGGSRDDLAVVDHADDVSRCGIVVFPSIHCARIGTRVNNHLVGTPGHDALCGLGGGDTIEGGAGADALDGGQGNDTVDGGPGRDRLFGGAGYDTVLARDGARDVVDCGKDVDTAVVDRLDQVAKNCENVLRKSR